ncbi:hypothetical protein MTY414_52880 [Mycolicibacterium mageritense]|nr:hypothetical protein MTY414_52880 [Mycolicibacterium mageritense]
MLSHNVFTYIGPRNPHADIEPKALEKQRITVQIDIARNGCSQCSAIFAPRDLSAFSGVIRTPRQRWFAMARPVMKRRERVRVEFSLTPELAARIYDYADAQSLTLSQTGERLLAGALPHQTGTSSTQCSGADSPASADRT